MGRRKKSQKTKDALPTEGPTPPENEDSLYAEFERIMSEEPEFHEESLAPELDEELLRALIRGELPVKSARFAYLLIYSFKSWFDAHTRILIEEYHRSKS